MVSVARKKAQARYDAANTKMVSIKLNLNTDKDILDRLEKAGRTEGKQTYIKRLIRADMSA